MFYRAKLRTIAHSVEGEGSNDHAAIEAALAECPEFRRVAWDVTVKVYAVYSNAEVMTYATTLGQYQMDVA